MYYQFHGKLVGDGVSCGEVSATQQEEECLVHGWFWHLPNKKGSQQWMPARLGSVLGWSRQKADVLSCSGSQKQQLLVRVALPARSVHGTAFLCSLRLGLQDGIYIHGRNTSIYIYRSWFCFYSSQDLFILFGKFSFILTVFHLFFFEKLCFMIFFPLLQLLAITQCFPDVM